MNSNSQIISGDESTDKTLIMVHGYGRNGEYSKPIAKEILKYNKYGRIILMDLPGHDGGKTNIGFKKSKELVYDTVESCSDEYGEDITLFGHSFGSFVISHLCNDSASNQYGDIAEKGVKELILSSLPYAMNQQKLTQYGVNKLGGKSHEEMVEFLRHFPKEGTIKSKLAKIIGVQEKLNRYITSDGHLQFGELTITDWQEYAKEFLSMPTMDIIDKISIPTTLIRGRVDLILWIATFESIGLVGLKSLRENYEKLAGKFEDKKIVSIPWSGHGHHMDKTHTKPPEEWPSQIQDIIKIINGNLT